ncbi:hypothetical protein K501DRAFT_266323 [Backusella circina FSU 941]|nr:hypothetical protein K501DRAFT_266323 [Backusella circina FSU 941]
MGESMTSDAKQAVCTITVVSTANFDRVWRERVYYYTDFNGSTQACFNSFGGASIKRVESIGRSGKASRTPSLPWGRMKGHLQVGLSWISPTIFMIGKYTISCLFIVYIF